MFLQVRNFIEGFCWVLQYQIGLKNSWYVDNSSLYSGEVHKKILIFDEDGKSKFVLYVEYALWMSYVSVKKKIVHP